MPDTRYHLALYTGPNGPISVTFDAPSSRDAAEHAAEHGDRWFDAAEDALDLDPDSETLDEDIVDALAGGMWSLQVGAKNNGGFSIYTQADYNFSDGGHGKLSDAWAHRFEPVCGSLDDAVRLSKTYECKLALTDAAGFARGWVNADGSYQLM